MAAVNRKERYDRRLSARPAPRRANALDIDFSDEPFWEGSMTPKTRPGKLKITADARAWTRPFFDGAVRGKWADLKRLAG
jgi:hypothetical protein